MRVESGDGDVPGCGDVAGDVGGDGAIVGAGDGNGDGNGDGDGDGDGDGADIANLRFDLIEFGRMSSVE